MDAIAGLLDGPRARQAFLLCSRLDPPWALRVEDEAPLTVVAMVRGRALLRHDDAAPVTLTEGDVAIVQGPDPYTVCDDLATQLQARIGIDQACSRPDGSPLVDLHDLGVRTWGNAAGEGETVMITGTYGLDGEVSRRLLRTLPRLAVLRAGEWDCPVVPLLADELVKDEPGQEAVLDRLLDLLLIAALRAWFARPASDTPPWFTAYGDPVVGHALKLIHHHPSSRWTVARLAREAGVSRAALARRFHELVGEPPMSFLTGWRIALAADLLLEPDATVGSVAHEVGYGSPYALSTAFKRVRGMSPQEHRRTLAAA